MKKIKRLGTFLISALGLVILMSLITQVLGQEITGSIVGIIKDSNGAAVAGATVTIKDTDKNIVVRTLTTNPDGEYSAPLLPVSHYSVTVEAPNFKKFIKTGIQLDVNDRLTVDAALTVGAVSEAIVVQASEEMVELQTATAGGLISGPEVRELPLNFRNYIQLLTLMPGVNSSLSDQTYIGTTNPLTGGVNTVSISVNGGRNAQNSWTVDSADNVDRGSNITLINYPSVDAIAEFKVLRNHYSAEYGRDAGGHVNVITKSGTSRFHGSAYEFFRNDVLNANSFFNNVAGIKKPPLRYNNFGYTIGGPLYIPNVYNENKDKTFFFFSQEYRRVITYTTLQGSVPTAAERQGTFSTPVCVGPGSATTCPTATQITSINPVAAAYIKDVFGKLPLPNAPTLGANVLITPGVNIINSRQELIRVDHNFNSKVTASLRFINESIPSVEPFGLFGPNASVPGIATSKSKSPGHSWMARSVQVISPTLLNEVGYSFSYGAILSDITGLVSKANSPDVAQIVKLAFPSTIDRIPTLNAGFSAVSGFGPYFDYNRNHNIFDNVTKIIGAHTLKFGTSIDFYQKTENVANGGNNAGTFTFSGTTRPAGTLTAQQAWANFLLGNVSSFSQASVDATPDVRERQFELYVQDDYRFRPNLTLNIGLRYSLFRQPYDARNLLNNFDPRAYDPAKAVGVDANGNRLACTGNCDPFNGIIQAGKNSPFGNKVLGENNNNFAPVIGFAWDPFKNGKTSIRGGYGISYDLTLVGIFEQNIATNPPLVSSITISNTRLEDPTIAAAPSAAPLTLRGTSFDAHTPYIQQWSLDVQREVSKDFIVDIGYFGSKGTHLLGVVDLNLLQPGAAITAGLQTAGTPITSATTPKLNQIRPFKGYNAINATENWFNSNYNSMQVSVVKRFGSTSSIRGAYTWSKNLTDNQSDRSNAPQDFFNRKAEYGPAVLDRAHVFTGSYIYALPFMMDQKGPIGRVLGGWEIAGITTYQTGLPLTATTIAGIDPAGIGFLGPSVSGPRPDVTGNPNSGPKTLLKWFNTAAFADPTGTTRPGNEGRGVIRAPGFGRWDMTLSKNFNFSENVKLQFRTEFYNIFNHTNFSGVNVSLGNASFGQINTTRDPRIMQFALKLYF